jgi:hypothetical protein
MIVYLEGFDGRKIRQCITIASLQDNPLTCIHICFQVYMHQSVYFLLKKIKRDDIYYMKVHGFLRSHGANYVDIYTVCAIGLLAMTLEKIALLILFGPRNMLKHV